MNRKKPKTSPKKKTRSERLRELVLEELGAVQGGTDPTCDCTCRYQKCQCPTCYSCMCRPGGGV